MRTLSILEDTVTPAALLARGGYPLHKSPHGVATVCPLDGHHILPVPGGFRCVDPSCRFGAGGVLDWLRLEHGGYLAALQKLRQLFPEIPALASLDPLSVTTAAEAAVARRRVYEFFRTHVAPADADEEQAWGWLRRQGIDNAAIKGFLFPASPAPQQALATLLSHPAFLSDDPPFQPVGETVILVPFFGTMHSVARVMSIPYRYKGRKPAVYTLDSRRASFGGLQMVHPAASIELCADPLTAAQNNTALARVQADRVCLPVLGDPRAATAGKGPHANS